MRMARSNVLFQEQQFHAKGANRSALRETDNTILITQHFGWEILPKRLQKAYVCYFPTTAPNRAASLVFSLTQYKLIFPAYYIFLLPLLVLESWKNSQAADGRILLPYHHKQIFSLLLYGQLVVFHCTLTITDFVEVFCCCLFLATLFSSHRKFKSDQSVKKIYPLEGRPESGKTWWKGLEGEI